MKFIFLILLQLSIYSYGQEFRNLKWGMTKQEVKKNEKLKFLGEQDGSLLFSGLIGGYKFTAVYQFDKENKFRMATLIYDETHVDAANYYESYKKIRVQLKNKYGPRLQEADKWKNTLYKDDEESYGLAASAGHVIFRTMWTTGVTNVGLMLAGDNFKCTLGITYRDSSYSEDIEDNSKEF